MPFPVFIRLYSRLGSIPGRPVESHCSCHWAVTVMTVAGWQPREWSIRIGQSRVCGLFERFVNQMRSTSMRLFCLFALVSLISLDQAMTAPVPEVSGNATEWDQCVSRCDTACNCDGCVFYRQCFTGCMSGTKGI